MVKKYFIWAEQRAMNKDYFYVVDAPGNVYGAGYSEKEAVQLAISKGIPECEIDMGDVV